MEATVNDIMKQLEALKEEKMRALHKKNGAGENMFGVKMGDIRTIAKKLKTNHKLGLSLWETDNIDARLLAVLLLNPKLLTPEQVDGMVRQARLPQLADWFNAYIVKDYPDKEILRQKWMLDTHPMAARAGWSLTSGRIVREPEGLNLPAILDRIEAEMPAAAPETQWTMNTALAQIGIHFPEHRQRALTIGEKLGIYRDYPVSKGCTSPFAPIWINEIVRRQS